MNRFFEELKRRNVFRVGAAYLIVVWLLLTVIETVSSLFEIPAWVPGAVLLLAVFGFVPALVIGWVFQRAPSGLALDKNVDRSESIDNRMVRELTRDAEYVEEQAPRPSSPAGNSWFFGIGIDQYAQFRTLNNAVKDVKDVIEELIERYGFSRDHVITLFNDEANSDNLIHEFDQLTENVNANDSLLVYFSGHGHLNKKTQLGFWIPYDAKKGRTARYIRNSTIRDYLKVIPSRHTLLISDACFSGSLFVRGASRSDAALHELESIRSRWAICSGRHDEEVYDGEPGGNSPFTLSILNVLRKNRNELLNVAKLADRVIEQTRSNYEQLPEGNPLYGVGHEGGQYVFHLQGQEEKQAMRT